MTKYSGLGPNVIYFKSKLELVEKDLFLRLSHQFKKNKGYLASLGSPTLELIKGCLNEIDEKKWLIFNENLDRRELVQTCLYRICMHLGNAEVHQDNFSKFAQYMELIHYELSTLLYLFEPFKDANFSDIYLERLDDVIPPPLKKYFSAGLTKSAMNTLTGIRVAVGPECQPTFTHGTHFEIMDIFGQDQSFDTLLKKKKDCLSTIDLYLGEFNHNISLFANGNNYTSSNPIKEIDLLLINRSEGKPLTVAMDCTIDYLKSSKARELIEHFTGNILAGDLNIIFYQSGQKFWLLGMDHVYGSPYFMLNNGDPKWKSFDMLKTSEAFKSDALSRQWFCLTNKYALTSDAYRKAIFENTRYLLDRVPAELLPENEGKIRISQASDSVDSCFIDIKCYGNESFSLAHQLQQRLYDRFIQQGTMLYSRAGYGYYHANLVKFMNGYDEEVNYKTLRITPGINPQENKILLAFFQDAINLPGF